MRANNTADLNLDAKTLKLSMMEKRPYIGDNSSVPISIILTAIMEIYLLQTKSDWKITEVNDKVVVPKNIDEWNLNKLNICVDVLKTIGANGTSAHWIEMIEKLYKWQKQEEEAHKHRSLIWHPSPTQRLREFLIVMRSYVIAQLTNNQRFIRTLAEKTNPIEEEIAKLKKPLDAARVNFTSIEYNKTLPTYSPKEAAEAKKTMDELSAQMKGLMDKLEKVKKEIDEIYSFESLKKQGLDHLTYFEKTLLPKDRASELLGDKTFADFMAHVLSGERKIGYALKVFDAVYMNPAAAQTATVATPAPIVTTTAPAALPAQPVAVVNAPLAPTFVPTSAPQPAPRPVTQTTGTTFNPFATTAPVPAPRPAAPATTIKKPQPVSNTAFPTLSSSNTKSKSSTSSSYAHWTADSDSDDSPSPYVSKKNR